MVVYLTNFKTNIMINWNNVLAYVKNGNPIPAKRVEKSEEEWKAILSPEQFRITRMKGTERAGSGAFCHAHDTGQYNCICCDTPLFDSNIKFDSGTGWPSFTEPITENAVKYAKDNSYGMLNIEVMCNVCDAHQGHVFPDGPEPSGLRYCINSESIDLVKESA